ncbi:probable serine/threonine-protein kinase qkgA [Vespa mandarinia]|uniref:probable serine/threonine-protein kinase qkgA n=1 Tax=Vespa mandarinia TaxID=7446 RepID=UPI0016123CE0|nr:probable serine/threonine-protein kinase qkgA [Vespa mandarinia]
MSIYNSTFVDLSNAKLTVFPNNIMQHFSRIRMLYLENNALSEIPEEIFPSLQNLEWLDVRNNQLKTLPKSIKSHSSLHTLLLQGNKIQVLPLELCMVPKLKNLQVARNPLTMPPANIVALGCSNILSFLKSEWNRLHPDEVGIIPVKEAKPKSLTVLNNETINKKKSDILKVVNCYSCSDISNKFNKMSMTEKRKAYKPSNRCKSKGTNLVKQNQLSWIDEITDMLNKEAYVLQKMKNKVALQEWRDDKSSFSKSMEKATKRREDDIPFAIDNVDDLYISKAEDKLNDKTNLQRRNKAIFVSPTNINKKIIELLDSLATINTDGITSMTPTSKQKSLNDTIKKICFLQKEIHHLQRHNITTMP